LLVEMVTKHEVDYV